MRLKLVCVYTLLFLGAFLFCACEKKDPASSSVSTWPTASPESQGFNSERLTTAYAEADKLPTLKSVVLIRNGYLVSEKYFHGNSATTLYHVRSVTKSVTAALVGIALQEGNLNSLEMKMDEFFPEQFNSSTDARKRQVTLTHLLTMSAGFQWNENTDYELFAGARDPIGLVFSRPMADEPGQRFRYNTASAHLLSPILTQKTRLKTLEFAQQKLFKPLEIPHVSWQTDPAGYYYGSIGLLLMPRDMAKFGYLFLNGGQWNGQQIVPRQWVTESLAAQKNLSSTFGPLTQISYGYLWWGGDMKGHRVSLAWGYGGQFIVLIPDLNLIIVTTAEWQLGGTEANDSETKILNFMANEILPVITN